MKQKKATTVDEQVKKLKDRNMIISDESKAIENLLDIGYYRLGFYWYPFETDHTSHTFEDGTLFEYAIKLYYFDFDLRNTLLKYISRIEVNFRTKLIYYACNNFKEDPFWYTKRENFTFSNEAWGKYQSNLADIRKESIIARDKRRHNNRKDAPAWKAMEFMMLGTIITLYDNLKDNHLKCEIAKSYGITKPNVLLSYMNTTRCLRNVCAHAKVLYDLSLAQAISGAGPLGDLRVNKNNFAGAYSVFRYMLERVSTNRVTNMKSEMLQAYDKIPYPKLLDIIIAKSGLSKKDL